MKPIDTINLKLIQIITKSMKQFIPKLGQEILDKQSEKFEVSIKEDGSKVTSSDLFASTKLIEFINHRFTEFDFSIISEEQHNSPLTDQYTWTIDPIDGTNSYIEKKDSFSIMVGLLHKKKAIWGMIYQPSNNQGYYAFNTPTARGAYLFSNNGDDDGNQLLKLKDTATEHILVMNRPNKPLRDWESALIKQFNITTTKHMGSLGLKLALIAEGKAHYYASIKGQFGIWDLVPSILILEEAGGFVCNLHGQSITYNQTNEKYCDGLIASYRDQYSEFKKIVEPSNL